MTQFTCKGVNRSITGYHLNTFTIRIFQRFSSVRKFQMGNFQKYWLQNIGQDFIVLEFFVGGRSCGRLMSPVQETQSMWEIMLLHWRLPCKGGGLTGMSSYFVDRCLSFCFWSLRCVFFFDLQILVTFKLCFLVYTYSRYRSETKVYTMMSNFLTVHLRLILDQQAKLGFHISLDRHCTPLWHIILIPSKP